MKIYSTFGMRSERWGATSVDGDVTALFPTDAVPTAAAVAAVQLSKGEGAAAGVTAAAQP